MFRSQVFGVTTKKFKIFYSVIRTNSVLMMNYFTRLKVSSYVFFHYKSVLSNVIRSGMWMFRCIFNYVSFIKFTNTTLPITRFFSSKIAIVFVSAFKRTNDSFTRLNMFKSLRTNNADTGNFPTLPMTCIYADMSYGLPLKLTGIAASFTIFIMRFVNLRTYFACISHVI